MTEPARPPTPAVQIGPLKIEGAWAIVILVLLLAIVVALIVLARPRPAMLLAGAMWIGFIVYWSATSLKAPAAQRTEPAASRQRHQTLLNVALLLLFVPVPGLRLTLLRGPMVPAAGLTVEVAGALLYMWSRRELGRNWSARISLQQDHVLVRSGPYARIRHPMYTALIGMAVGTAIVANELHAVFGVLTMAYAYVRKIALEERWMQQEFGAAYDDYRRATWALIPPLY